MESLGKLLSEIKEQIRAGRSLKTFFLGCKSSQSQCAGNETGEAGGQLG